MSSAIRVEPSDSTVHNIDNVMRLWSVLPACNCQRINTELNVHSMWSLFFNSPYLICGGLIHRVALHTPLKQRISTIRDLKFAW